MTTRLLYVLLIFIAIIQLGYAQNDRYALVIGVQNYKNVAPLRNSKNDALEISKVLGENGFEVTKLIDPPTKRELRDAISNYYKLMQEKREGLALFITLGMACNIMEKII